jgi:hypothetical protein
MVIQMMEKLKMRAINERACFVSTTNIRSVVAILIIGFYVFIFTELIAMIN